MKAKYRYGVFSLFLMVLVGLAVSIRFEWSGKPSENEENKETNSQSGGVKSSGHTPGLVEVEGNGGVRYSDLASGNGISIVRIMDVTGRPISDLEVRLSDRAPDGAGPGWSEISGELVGEVTLSDGKSAGEYCVQEGVGGYLRLSEGLGVLYSKPHKMEEDVRLDVYVAPIRKLELRAFSTEYEAISSPIVRVGLDCSTCALPSEAMHWLHRGKDGSGIVELITYEGVGMYCTVESPGFHPGTIADAWNCESPKDVLLTKIRGRGDAELVEGVVFAHEGTVVHGALIAVGGAVTSSNSRGEFSVRMKKPLESSGLTVFYQAGKVFEEYVLTDIGSQFDDEWEVVVQLPPQREPIHARVVRANGDPVAGLKVVLLEGTKVGGIGYFAESLIIKDQTGRVTQTTDDEGFIHIPNLRGKEVRVAVEFPRPVIGAKVVRLAPNVMNQVIIEERAHFTLRGQILDQFGRPIVKDEIYIAPVDTGEGSNRLNWSSGSIGVDENGRFGPVTVDSSGEYLLDLFSRESGRSIATKVIEGDDVNEEIKWVVPVPYEVKLVWRGARSGVVRFLDANGESVNVDHRCGEAIRHTDSIGADCYQEGMWVLVSPTVVKVVVVSDDLLITSKLIGTNGGPPSSIILTE